MKKLLLMSILAFSSIYGIKAQQTMIVHGTTATKFYLYENHQVYKIMADELWFSDGNASEPGGIIHSLNLTLTPVPNYDPGDEPIEIYMSCAEARANPNHKGQCGPLQYVGRQNVDGGFINHYICYDQNNNACCISNGNLILFSADGNFDD